MTIEILPCESGLLRVGSRCIDLGTADGLTTVEFEGVTITYRGDSFIGPDAVAPGTLYFARGRSGDYLLTVKRDDVKNGWVVSNEAAYPHDRHRCFVVVSIDGEEIREILPEGVDT